LPPLNYESKKVVVNHLPWLSIHLGNGFLCVYRSVALLDTDPLYLPVQEFLDSTVYTVLDRVILDDEEMMFSQAEMCTYLIPEEA
jgi:hypothetical protein